MNVEEILSHPYWTTPVALGAVVNPWVVDGLPIALQALGAAFLVIQIFYIIKNKGKK